MTLAASETPKELKSVSLFRKLNISGKHLMKSGMAYVSTL